MLTGIYKSIVILGWHVGTENVFSGGQEVARKTGSGSGRQEVVIVWPSF